MGLGWDDGRNGRGGSWGLDEDDLVVLLGNGSTGDHLWALFFGFWGRYVDVDVFLDDGSATAEAAASEATAAASESTTNGSASETAANGATGREPSRGEPSRGKSAAEAAGAQATGGESTTVSPADAAPADATPEASVASAEAAMSASEATAPGCVITVARLGPRRAKSRYGS